MFVDGTPDAGYTALRIQRRLDLTRFRAGCRNMATEPDGFYVGFYHITFRFAGI